MSDDQSARISLVYITKYALTRGILTYKDAEHDGPYWITVRNVRGSWLAFRKPYWHETLESAREHEKTLLAKKLRTLQNQLNRYNGYQAKVVEG